MSLFQLPFSLLDSVTSLAGTGVGPSNSQSIFESKGVPLDNGVSSADETNDFIK